MKFNDAHFKELYLPLLSGIKDDNYFTQRDVVFSAAAMNAAMRGRTRDQATLEPLLTQLVADGKVKATGGFKELLYSWTKCYRNEALWAARSAVLFPAGEVLSDHDKETSMTDSDNTPTATELIDDTSKLFHKLLDFATSEVKDLFK